MQSVIIHDDIIKDRLRIRLLEDEDGYFVELITYFGGMRTDNAMTIRFDVFDDAVEGLYRTINLLRETRDNNPPLMPVIPHIDKSIDKN